MQISRQNHGAIIRRIIAPWSELDLFQAIIHLRERKIEKMVMRCYLKPLYRPLLSALITKPLDPQCTHIPNFSQFDKTRLSYSRVTMHFRLWAPSAIFNYLTGIKF